MQLQAFNWLNIAQMNLFSRRKITVAVVVDIGWMGVKCKLWVQQCFIVLFTLFYWMLSTVARIKRKKSMILL